VKPQWIFLGTVVLLAPFTVSISANDAVQSGAFRVSTTKDLTENMPDADRIEVSALENSDHDTYKIVGTKVLEGSSTATLLHLWRTQQYRYNCMVNCHEPGFRVRFYQAHTLLTEATICFKCHNIYFYKSAGASSEFSVVFNLQEKDSDPDPLHNYLASLFPGHDPDAGKP